MSMWRSTQVEPGGPKKVGGLAFEDESGRGADKVSSFLDCLDADKTPDAGVKLTASSTQVILATYKSSSRGEPVQLYKSG